MKKATKLRVPGQSTVFIFYGRRASRWPMAPTIADRFIKLEGMPTGKKYTF
tara:strand:- start:176 stop:328 length:153 start_codon:yes stop_codon:yes gene_type:complete